MCSIDYLMLGTLGVVVLITKNADYWLANVVWCCCSVLPKKCSTDYLMLCSIDVIVFITKNADCWLANIE